MARFTLHIEVEDDSIRQVLEPLLASLGAAGAFSPVALGATLPLPPSDATSSSVTEVPAVTQQRAGEVCEIYVCGPYTLRVSRTKARARIFDVTGHEIGLTDGQQEFLCALTLASADCPLTYESDCERGHARSRSAFDKMRKSLRAIAPELVLARPAGGTGFFLKHLDRR